MNIKKFAGLLLAVLTLCSPATTVSEADEINTEGELGTLFSNGGDGTIMQSIPLLSSLTVSADTIIHSNSGNKYTISGSSIAIAADKQIQVYDIEFNNVLSLDSGAKLLVGKTGYETQGVDFSAISGQGNITLNSSRTINFSNDVKGTSLTIGSNNTSNISFNGDVTLSGSFSQNNGTVDLGKNLSASSITINNGELNLDSSSEIQADDGISIVGGSINSSSSAKSGTINAGSQYLQRKSTSNVYVGKIYVDSELGEVLVRDGNLNATQIGDSSNIVHKYE